MTFSLLNKFSKRLIVIFVQKALAGSNNTFHPNLPGGGLIIGGIFEFQGSAKKVIEWDFGPENAASEGMWVQGGGTELPYKYYICMVSRNTITYRAIELKFISFHDYKCFPDLRYQLTRMATTNSSGKKEIFI